MKKKFILGLLLLSRFSAAQNAVQNYLVYDIKNSSCEIINSVNTQLNSSNNSDRFKSLIKTEQAKNKLESKNDVETFVNDFNNSLSKTKKQYESQEFLWRTGKEISKYGLSVLGNYAQALPTKHITNFLTPAIQQGYELYVDNEIHQGINNHKDQIDKIISDRVNLLYSNGINVSQATDESTFNAMFALAHADIPALDREQYGIFNKELTKIAYNYIEKNRKDIKLLDLKILNQYELVKQEVNTKLDIYQKKITREVDDNFKELGNSISSLLKNQEQVFETLDDIKNRVVTNEKKIKVLESEMYLVRNDLNLLKSKQEEHGTLLAQNSFQIDILSGYTFQNLNTGQKLNSLKNGHFNNIFKESEKTKLISELEKIQTKETIISVSNTVQNYANVGFEVLSSSGILKGKDAKNVAKFVHGLSIVTGIARVYAGDFSGFASIISGIGGLFSKPTPSPEMQMLSQIYDVMNQRFDRVDSHLNRIETKIDTLANVVFRMYKTMVLSFQYTGNQIERLNWKVNNLNTKATALLYKDYQACKTLDDIWVKRKIEFDKYSDLETNYNATCQKCLEGLNDFTIGKDLSYFFVKSNQQLKDESFVQVEVMDIYNPTRDLFKKFYSDILSHSLYALMFPFSGTKDSNKPLYAISNMIDLNPIEVNNALDEYYSYEMLKEFSEMLLTFGRYFETAGSNSNFKPLSLDEYLISNSVNGVNQDLLESRLLKLLSIIQYSISQQSLMGGNLMLDPIYSSLFNYSSKIDEIDLSISVLNNNKLLSSNFATYLINKNVDFSDTIKVKGLFEGASLDQNKLNDLNSLIRVNDFKFILNPSDGKLYLSFDRREQKIRILCPDITRVIDNKMINSEAVYFLLDCREKINSKLIDLTFSRNLPSNANTFDQFKFHYLPTIK
ncbi:hypothetical protein [Dyadobacter sp. 32]|uniref:hypothetical protein n=1 Tax=Dyadobacter sp. 32 TaxID=538966 RepID=UPI0011EF6D3F